MQRMVFSTSSGSDLQAMHAKQHKNLTIDPKYHVDDFESTYVSEIEFVRSPFYELGKLKHATPEEAHDLLDTLQNKREALFGFEAQVKAPRATNENASLTRYADKVEDPELQGVYQTPTYRPYEIIDPVAHFRV